MSNEEDRAALDIAVMTVLTNVMNFPEKVQARLLGQDMRQLGDRVIDAVLDAGFHRTPAPAPADALREVKAQAWREGWDASERFGYLDGVLETQLNPYLEADDDF